MAKRSFQHHKRKATVEKKILSSPSAFSTLLVLVLIARHVLAIILSPLRYPLRFVVITLSIWLGIGTVLYGSAYLYHLGAYKQKMFERTTLISQQITWKYLLSVHPTSREILLGAYATSFALGEDHQASLYVEQLKRIDPNDSRVKSL